mgnify:FL=1
MNALINAQKVSFHRHGERVFMPIDMVVRPESLHLIRGRNGAGKTTLLRLLAGILLPCEGSLQRTGGVAFVGHQPGVKNDLSALDMLKFYARFSGADPAFAPLTPHQALNAAGLASKARHKAGQLSAGQRRRLGLARLLVAPKKAWLLDEPYTSLDAEGCAWVDDLLGQHLASGGGVAVTAHVYQPKLSQHVHQLDIEPGQRSA